MQSFRQLTTGRIGPLFLMATLFIAGCASFGHLTRLPSEGQKEGPKASDCGSCHVEQYREWQTTAHARALTNTAFQEEAGNPPEADCLTCHSPLGAASGAPEGRTFNQHEGVTCISCHLSGGAMHGPHARTALFEPHPIEVDQELYTSSTLCASCHDETHAQWQKTAEQGRKSCQQCHLQSVTRRATQGTSAFSNFLVSYEEEHATRSHAITLEKMALFPGAVTISAVRNKTVKAPTLEVTVRNNLPHALPTGTYGRKEVRLVLVVEQDGRRLFEHTARVGNEQHPLAAGDSTTVTLPLPATPLAGTPRLSLERFSAGQTGRTPIVLATTTIHFAAESPR